MQVDLWGHNVVDRFKWNGQSVNIVHHSPILFYTPCFSLICSPSGFLHLLWACNPAVRVVWSAGYYSLSSMGLCHDGVMGKMAKEDSDWWGYSHVRLHYLTYCPLWVTSLPSTVEISSCSFRKHICSFVGNGNLSWIWNGCMEHVASMRMTIADVNATL